MAYRKTKRSLETLAKMRAGRDAARMEMPAPDLNRYGLRRGILSPP